MRVLLFTGKGGVGKTTTAAATALRLAEAGLRVAVTSADPAHSLADSFGVELGPRPTEVAPNCWAQEIDSRERLEESWGEIREWLLEVFDWAGVDALEAEELSVVPGLDELFALTELDGLCSSGDYDVVLVDCAPTAVTSVRLVVNPERMVVAEARRTYTYLSLFGYHVDAVVVNRVLPDEVSDPWFARWRESQAEHLGSIVDDFAPLPVLRASLAQEEVVGVDALRDLAKELWDGIDPVDRLVVGRPLRIERDGESFTLVVELPFADHDVLDVSRSGDELVVAVGPHRRNLVLPESLRRREVAGASLDDGCLRVRFSV